jgi:hypothetical protein
VAVEALELDEEMGVGEEGIDDANAVAGIHRRDKAMAAVSYGLHVPRGNVPRRSDQGEAQFTRAHLLSFVGLSQE